MTNSVLKRIISFVLAITLLYPFHPTAGHCLYGHKSIFGNTIMEGWAGKILCVPAYRVDSNGNAIKPFGESYQVLSRMKVGDKWRDYKDYNHDWGILELQTPINVGRMPLRELDYSGDITDMKVYFAGYPGSAGTNMKRMYTTIVDYTTYRGKLEENSYNGQSGGPVWDTSGNVIGIISQGDEQYGGTWFIKLTETAYRVIYEFSRK